jgi:thiamine kinase-like enzyme
MKQVLKEGKMELLIPERAGGGLTRETHIVRHKGKKYVLRKCLELSKARYYEHLSEKFEKHGFLPKFLGRLGKNVFYEYIDGRDLRGKKERLDNIKEVGKILAMINKYKIEKSEKELFKTQVKELVLGNYNPSLKVQIARKARKVRKKPKALLTKEEGIKILSYFKKLKKELKPKLVYECTDTTPGNFRVRKGKVYLVDIESIKPRYKGLGITKFFNEWGKTTNKRKEFIKGYKSKNSLKFLNDKYKKFIELIFLINRLNFSAQTGKEYKSTIEKIIELSENEAF